MKRLRWVFFFVAALGYFLWPYNTANKFARAAENYDAETIMAMTDKVALRESLERIFIEGTVMREIEVRGRNLDEAKLRARARQIVDSPAMQRRIDESLRPEVVRARLTAVYPKYEKGATVWRDETWHSPWKFSVRDQQGGRLFFRFNGFSWKYSGVEFTKDELRRQVTTTLY